MALLAALAVPGAAICAGAQKKATERPAEPGAQAKTTPSPDVAEGRAEAARYRYEFTNPNFLIQYIKIVHDEAGRGTVTFERKSAEESITEPLELSPESLRRITSLWEALRFLDSDTNYQSEKQFAHLGTVRLSMARGARDRTAEFNWSNVAEVAALTNEYRRAADQAMAVFEINVARENQPLESPKLLEHLDKLVARGGVSDASQLVPFLRELRTDERLPLIARNRAEKIL